MEKTQRFSLPPAPNITIHILFSNLIMHIESERDLVVKERSGK